MSQNKVTINLELDNAGWHNEDGSLNRLAVKDALYHAVHVLTETTSYIADEKIYYTISDVNGNSCGKATLAFKREED